MLKGLKLPPPQTAEPNIDNNQNNKITRMLRIERGAQEREELLGRGGTRCRRRMRKGDMIHITASLSAAPGPIVETIDAMMPTASATREADKT